jgi:hypothetical protein
MKILFLCHRSHEVIAATCVETNHNSSQLLERLEGLVTGGDQFAAGSARSSLH